MGQKCFDNASRERIMKSLKNAGEPKVSRIYSWKEVQRNWGGEQTFLAQRNGRIICATLRPDKNPFWPDVMTVGKKPKNMRRAETFCRQGGSIPVFTKEQTNQWRYMGRFEISHFIADKQQLSSLASTYGKSLSRIIFMRSVDNPDYASLLPDVQPDGAAGREGGKKLTLHFRLERNRGLIIAKKKKVLAETGRLACEACAFNFADKYGSAASNFCEVHHRKRLADLDEISVTTLEDLAIICSNCHSIIHLLRPMPSIEEFRKQFRVRGD